jgi:4-amino-4-deoxy-L-arabinose transferase-like glycosyltransferase
MTTGRGQRLRFFLGLLPPLVVAAALRGFRLAPQILIGDELHAVSAALRRPIGQILRQWTYQGADYCVPLTAFFRFLMDRGVALSEWWLRAPSLAAGLLTVVVIPWALAPRIGRRAAWLLAWLLAVSPLLVLYSRIVRSYAPMVLLAGCALIAFDRWWRTRSRRAGLAFVASGAAAAYFHLGALPLVLAPFLYAGGASALRGSRRLRAEGPRLALLLGALAFVVAALLFPARESLVELARLHDRGHFPPPAAWAPIALLELGTTHWSIALVLLAALARGAAVLVHRDGAFAAYLGVTAVGQVVGLAILSPNFLEVPSVASRYLLALLPFALAVAAVGLAEPWRTQPSRRDDLGHAIAVAGLLLVAVATGPLARPELRTSSFVHSGPGLFFTRAPDRIAPEDVPAFYRGLAEGGRDAGMVLEYPWLNLASHAFRLYQDVHRQPVKVAIASAELLDERVALRNIVSPTPAALLASGARYLVLHLDLRKEEARVTSADPYHALLLAELPGFWNALHNNALRTSSRLREAWGAPTYEDDQLRVWDLEAVSPPRVPRGGQGPTEGDLL